MLRAPVRCLLSRGCRDRAFTSIRTVSSAQDKVKSYKPGDVVQQFQVEQVEEVKELSLTAICLRHIGTDANYLHIAREDQNNVFGVAFRTVPMDSSGVAHILEHTVLCGSKRFPVRDPFFNMLTRSLATFMNAFTSSDWTMYPFSTQNAKDFKNLMSVYLDAVFYPLLTRWDFLQEGWRLEHMNPEDPRSPVVIKGVVYNEMKGVYGDREQQFCRYLQSSLLPSHTYSNCSGGDPQIIPNLTYEGLQKFHVQHYHPSNARFYSYGNLPFEDHLSFLHEEYLSKFDRSSIDTTVQVEPRWNKPRNMTITGPPDPLAADPDKQTTIAVSYLLSKTTDVFDSFVLQIISDLLLNGPSAPFYKALLEPNIGSGFFPYTGYWGHTKESSFAVGLQGIRQKDVNKVAEIIDNTLIEVMETGFPKDRIEAVIHNLELGCKHEKANFGLDILLNLISMWNHEGNPVANMKINKNISRFWNAIEDNPTFLQDQIEKHFVNNNHKLIAVMDPDENYELNTKQKEDNLIKSKVEQLTKEDEQKLREEAITLKEKQSKKENVSSLPTLTIADINPKITTWEFNDNLSFGVASQYTQQPTNGITYFKALFNTNGVSEDLRPYIPLFTEVVTKMGAGDMDYRQLDQRIQMKTGGLNVGTLIVDNPDSLGSHAENVSISSYCLDSNLVDMFDIWSEIVRSVRFDDGHRLRTLIRESAAELGNSVVQSGHSYAMRKALASLSQASMLREHYSGLHSVLYMKELAAMDDVTSILNKLNLLANEVFQRKRMALCLNTDLKNDEPNLVNNLMRFLALMADNLERTSTDMDEFTVEPCKTHYALPLPVHFSSLGFATVPYTHEDSAALKVLARLLSFKYLHREIREKGGAYGGGAQAASDGYFSFYSYRDPQGIKTFNIFQESIDWAINGDFTDKDVDEAKLSVFQNEDKPIPPESRGIERFFLARSYNDQQTHRDRLLSCTGADLRRAAEKYLTVSHNGSCMLGPTPDTGSLPNPWVSKEC